MLSSLLKNLLFQSKKNPSEILSEPDLKDSIEQIKELCGEGLISCEIVDIKTKKSILKYNTQESVTELFSNISQYISKSLTQKNFPNPEHYLISLENNFTAIVLFADSIQCNILVNNKEANVGIIVNILLPDLKTKLCSYTKPN